MLHKRYFSFLFCFFCGLGFLNAQLINKSDVTSYKSLELIHIHFDKEIYLPGETIWFKAYIYWNNLPSVTSTNICTAIYDGNGKLLDQKQYPVFESTCNGSFELPDTLTTGKIQFIAFTKNMLKTDSIYYFKRVLSLHQKNNKSQNNISANENSISVSFYPEGGQVIEGLPNYFAIKAVYTNGEAAAIKGWIIDSATQYTVDTFFTNQSGIGQVQITPALGKTYIAHWSENNFIKKTTIYGHFKNGIVFHSVIEKNVLYYNILKNSDDTALYHLRLIATRGNEELYSASIHINENKQFVSKILLDSFPMGPLQLNLYDAAGIVLHQQLVFINMGYNTKQAIQINQLKYSHLPKGKNVIELEINDSSLHNLSVSIADMNFFSTKRLPSIKQDFWFNGDKILNTGINTDSLKESERKVLMQIIQADYIYENLPNQKAISSDVDNTEDYLTLELLYNNKNKRLPDRNALNLIIDDKNTGKQLYKLSQNSGTLFKKSGLIFYDSSKVFYKLDVDNELADYLILNLSGKLEAPQFINTTENENCVKNQFLDTISTNYLDSFTVNKPEKFNREKTLKQVVIKTRKWNTDTKRILELDEKYASGMFRGIAKGYQLNVIDDPSAIANSDIFSYVGYRIPGLKITYKTGNREIQTFDISRNRWVAVPVFINETESPPEVLEGLPLSQIVYIKFIPGIVIGSSLRTSNGVLYIYTRKGDEENTNFPTSMKHVKLKGYDLTKAFQNPDYDGNPTPRKSDLRSTVYWNPYLVPNKSNNRIQFEYYNNDVSKKMLMVVEGFTDEGRLVHIEKIIE